MLFYLIPPPRHPHYPPVLIPCPSLSLNLFSSPLLSLLISSCLFPYFSLSLPDMSPQPLSTSCVAVSPSPPSCPFSGASCPLSPSLSLCLFLPLCVYISRHLPHSCLSPLHPLSSSPSFFLPAPTSLLPDSVRLSFFLPLPPHCTICCLFSLSLPLISSPVSLSFPPHTIFPFCCFLTHPTSAITSFLGRKERGNFKSSLKLYKLFHYKFSFEMCGSKNKYGHEGETKDLDI